MRKKYLYITAFTVLILLIILFFLNKNDSFETTKVDNSEENTVDINDKNYENYYIIENLFKD